MVVLVVDDAFFCDLCHSQAILLQTSKDRPCGLVELLFALVEGVCRLRDMWYQRSERTDPKIFSWALSRIWTMR
jgi:hypothetical protein